MKILQTEQVSRPFGYIFFEIRKGEREGGGVGTSCPGLFAISATDL